MNALFSNAPDWVWVPVVLFAVVMQTVRNTAQRQLTDQVGTWSATLVRFLYGLPFAALWLVLLYQGPQGDAPALPQFNLRYVAWVATGALFQLLATAALLLAMQARNFAVAITLSKTEVLQVTLFAAVFLHELPGPLVLWAMAVASVGVLLLTLPAGAASGARGGGMGRSALYGLACGAGFAIAAVGFRGAALALPDASPWVSGAWSVLIAQALQSAGLGGWVALRTPDGLRPLARAWRFSLMAGSAGAAASLAWFTAYAMQQAATVRTLSMVEVVLSYLVSRRLLRESLTGVEKLGMALTLLGFVLICLQAL